MNASSLCLVIAVLFFAVAALLAFGVFVGSASVVGLIAVGLGFFAAAHFPRA